MRPLRNIFIVGVILGVGLASQVLADDSETLFVVYNAAPSTEGSPAALAIKNGRPNSKVVVITTTRLPKVESVLSSTQLVLRPDGLTDADFSDAVDEQLIKNPSVKNVHVLIFAHGQLHPQTTRFAFSVGGKYAIYGDGVVNHLENAAKKRGVTLSITGNACHLGGLLPSKVPVMGFSPKWGFTKGEDAQAFLSYLGGTPDPFGNLSSPVHPFPLTASAMYEEYSKFVTGSDYPAYVHHIKGRAPHWFAYSDEQGNEKVLGDKVMLTASDTTSVNHQFYYRTYHPQDSGKMETIRRNCVDNALLLSPPVATLPPS